MVEDMLGRRLTFVNAYLSLALSLLGVAWFVWEASTTSIPARGGTLHPLYWGALVRYASRAWFDLLSLRRGNVIADRWGWRFSWLAPRWAISVGAVALFAASVFVQTATPIQKLDVDWFLFQSVVPMMAAVVAERAVWEWRRHHGNVPFEQLAPLESQEVSSALPTTAGALRKRIASSKQALRLGPWLAGILLSLPGIILLARRDWIHGGLMVPFGIASLMMCWEAASKALKQEVEEGERALNRLQKPSPAPVAPVAESEAIRQELHGS